MGSGSTMYEGRSCTRAQYVLLWWIFVSVSKIELRLELQPMWSFTCILRDSSLHGSSVHRRSRGCCFKLCLHFSRIPSPFTITHLLFHTFSLIDVQNLSHIVHSYSTCRCVERCDWTVLPTPAPSALHSHSCLRPTKRTVHYDTR